MLFDVDKMFLLTFQVPSFWFQVPGSIKVSVILELGETNLIY